MGPCRDNFNRWFFDAERATCLPFIYGGCAGNMNRFKNFESCISFCSEAIEAAGRASPTSTVKAESANEVDVDGPEATPRPRPPPEEERDRCAEALRQCRAMRCPYGVERYVAETGCDECRCHEPCREHRCQAGTECHAELVRANSVDGDADASSSSSVGDVVETRVQAVCRPLRKEGRCPEVPRIHEAVNCENECRSDADCQQRTKCCYNGCGRSCMAPVDADAAPGVTRAPAPPPPPSPAPTQPTQRPGTPPRIVDGETRVSAEEGSVARLRCQARGDPAPNIYWRRGNEEVVHDQGKYRIDADGTLELIGLARSDAGGYTCIADNGVGSPALKQVHLEVAVPPSVRAWTERSTYAVGAEVSVHCDVSGNPPPQVNWYKDDQPVVVSERVQITGNHSVVISAAATTDGGNYRCQALNLIGRADSAVSVVVDGVYLHPNCTDNPFFANCRLIIKARYCTNKYYARFCCKSCTLAGQLPTTGPHLLDYKTAFFESVQTRRIEP